METIKQLTQEIKSTLTQTSSSQKDEQRFMRTMLNDREYVVDEYAKGEVVGQVCPAKEARAMAASVISSTTKISAAEAQTLADAHEFKSSEAANMVAISKQFVNGYVETGRKLPFGGRENLDVAVSLKNVPASDKTYPKRVGVGEDGKGIYHNETVHVPAYNTLKVHTK